MPDTFALGGQCTIARIRYEIDLHLHRTGRPPAEIVISEIEEADLLRSVNDFLLFRSAPQLGGGQMVICGVPITVARRAE